MIKKILKYIKSIALLLFVFAFFWFLNSGFLTNPFWLVVQSGLFTVLIFIIYKYPKIKLFFWFLTVGIFYILSSILEIFQLHDMAVMSASTGFGTLVVIILFQILKKD